MSSPRGAPSAVTRGARRVRGVLDAVAFGLVAAYCLLLAVGWVWIVLQVAGVLPPGPLPFLP